MLASFSSWGTENCHLASSWINQTTTTNWTKWKIGVKAPQKLRSRKTPRLPLIRLAKTWIFGRSFSYPWPLQSSTATIGQVICQGQCHYSIERVVKKPNNISHGWFFTSQVEWGLHSEWLLFDWGSLWRLDKTADQFLHRQANLIRRDSMVEAKVGIRVEKHDKHPWEWHRFKIKCFGRIWMSYVWFLWQIPHITYPYSYHNL